MTSQDDRPEHEPPESDAARALRQEAEARIGSDATPSSTDLAALTPEAIRRTLHELQVHQIELTMQNEELRRVQAEIDAVRARYFDLYDLAPVGYCTLSETGLILEANLTAASLLATPKSALIKQPLSRFIVKDDQDLYYLHRKRLFETGEPQECDLRQVKADGARVWVHLAATAAQADDGASVCRVVISDITALKEQERRLEHLALFDTLTALPNRRLLADRLNQAMAQTQRRGQRLAVGYLDLDDFKTINDRHGHEVGDGVLVAVAERMQAVLREGDTLARLGGDEFAMVLIDLADPDVSAPLLERLLAAAAEPVRFGDLLVLVSASLGVTFYPQAGVVDGDLLLRQADQAMYQAKQSGKNHFFLFDTQLEQRIRSHHEHLEQTRHALAAREFVLYYQPKVNLRTGTVIGAEALIRWRHPQRGLLAPALFLPTTENHPLAVEIGEWVIKTALAQTDVWRALGLALPVSVNVGARQLQQVDFVARLRAMLGEHPGVAPSCLCLEILETSAIDDLVGTSLVIDACRELGVSVALDDFGTGYSSLTYLKRLAVTQLKIDKSFVSGMLNDPEDLAIVESILSLAGTFNRQVIAEGVETLEHGEMLLRFGCDLAQGFGIARPMPAHEMPGWLAAWQTPACWAELPAARREHLPLLYASVEHRAWVAAIEAHLRSEQGVPPLPPLDRRQCRFAAWLRAEVASGDGAEPDFQRIDALHRQVHGVVDELLELRARGRHPEALARLGELHDLMDSLVDGLKAWVRARDQSTAMIGEARLSDLYGHLGQAR
ncbi:EAL domain-containing protein [Thiocapsa marina]|uniref:Diguanylate cyclase/phosphodiesterase with PAS/PAC sensor(S) n=1 Tax=Thiocapsa marina 5811 TaxID=768671 RepID=F9U7L3_9GAMM|nr:EAL domain-containing protein [Thiocapsa marina]EGV19643.1 diguanylate cyclase/phosphodiesterase with PAS/PAC sensor(s) [Thiocapsa marina 5811]